MSWPPVSSQDVAEAREASGGVDVIDRRERVEQVLHDELCHDGWIGADEDRPQPCYVCRPHLRQLAHHGDRHHSTTVPGPGGGNG